LIDDLKRVAWLRGGKGWFPLKVIRKFTQEEIERTANNYTLGPGDVVLILDTTGGGGQTAEKLLSYRIKAIVGNIEQFSYYARKKLAESEIPLVNSFDIEIIRIDEIAVMKETTLTKLIEEAQSEIDVNVAEKKETFLDGLVNEYRRERVREIAEYDEMISRERKKTLHPDEREDDNK
jgi:predicted RNase H-like nuclease (RuvC/YqgF family)